MIRRPPRSTQSRSSAASDVYKRQSQKLTYLYSYLRLLVEDIKSNAPTLPHGVSLDFNDCLTIARTGKLERPYTLEGEEFKYVVNHSVVEDLQRAGKEAFVKNQPKTNSKWDTNWED